MSNQDFCYVFLDSSMTADENTRTPKKGKPFDGVSGAVWEQNHATARRILEHFSRFGSKTTPLHQFQQQFHHSERYTAQDSHISNYEAGQLTDDTHHYHITGTTLPLLYVPKRYRPPRVFNCALRKTHHEDDVTWFSSTFTESKQISTRVKNTGNLPGPTSKGGLTLDVELAWGFLYSAFQGGSFSISIIIVWQSCSDLGANPHRATLFFWITYRWESPTLKNIVLGCGCFHPRSY